MSYNEEKKFDYDGKQSTRYYKLASEGNERFQKSLVYKKILEYIRPTDTLCEFGCGDGTKLVHLSPLVKKTCGFDLSRKAIALAKKHIPGGVFYTGNSAKVFGNTKFDITTSFFVLEHDPNPVAFLDDMIAHTKPGGYIICAFPNYGSPFFPSPPSCIDTNPLQKIILVIKRIILYPKEYNKQPYQNVIPITDRTFESDYDTVSEISLEKLFKHYSKHIIYADSGWECLPNRMQFLPFRFLKILAWLRIQPFVYLGPQVTLVLKK